MPRAQTAEVPSIPWSGDGLVAELTEEGTIPDETFQKAMVTTVDEAVAAAERIGEGALELRAHVHAVARREGHVGTREALFDGHLAGDARLVDEPRLLGELRRRRLLRLEGGAELVALLDRVLQPSAQLGDLAVELQRG